MRRKVALALIGAVGLALSSASVVRAAATFTENFTSGDVTDGGLWTSGTVTGSPSNVSFTEPVGGPLTIGVSGAASGTTEGGYIQTTSTTSCNPVSGPLLMTVTAPVVGGVQQSLTPSANTNFNSAATMLGVSAAGQRLDTGPVRAYTYLNGGNNLQFSLEYNDPEKAGGPGLNFVNQGIFSGVAVPATTATDTIAVTSLWIYLDGSQGSNNFWIDFGATWLDTNTTTNATTPGSLDWAVDHQHYAASPYTDPATGKRALNLFKGSPYFSSWSSAEIASMESQFAGGAVGDLEVLANSNNGSAGNTVSFGQLSVLAPEPASLGLVTLAAGLVLRRRRGH